MELQAEAFNINVDITMIGNDQKILKFDNVRTGEPKI